MTCRGGVYLWRVRKPHAFLGLPVIGRHNGYVGMTNNYDARGGQHLNGSIAYGTKPASWSDLEPKCWRILPLPSILTHGKWRRRIVLKSVETAAMWLLLPVYNERQQAPYNARKRSRKSAARERARRDMLGRPYAVVKFVLRMALYLAIGTGFMIGKSKGWWG